ncbi:MAG: HAMP domain-containing sensor histidine kinase [Anaerolineae bacterium]
MKLQLSPVVELVGTVLIAFLLAMVVVVPVLNPPSEDINHLFLTMGNSGLVTVGLTYFFYKRRILQRFLSLRWTLFTIIALTVLLIFVNVWITARLMFITEHDLVLTTGLLIFGGIIAAVSTLFIARTLRERINELSEGITLLARADWKTRLPVNGSDELAHLANMFNKMAADLEELDEQKRQLEQTRRDLIAWVSHDLRTPLAAMRAMNEAMLDGVVTDPETIARYQTNTLSEIQHLSRLIDDLFELAQLDTGHLSLNLQMTSLRDLVSDTLSRMKPRAEADGVDLSAVVDPAVDIIYVAPDKIQRVLYNLLDNALQYTPQSGRISLEAHPQGRTLLIAIHNTGSHISARDLPNVFKSFYRGEQSRATDNGKRGTGLGLAIVRGFVEAHGGSIAVSSERQSGTTFTLSLPNALPA